MSQAKSEQVKDPNALSKVKPSAAAMAVTAMPDFLSTLPVEGVEDLGKYVTYPRLKIIQKMASAELQEKHNIGEIVMMPEGLVVANIDRDERGRPVDKGQPVNFIPIAFFEQWCTWGDIADRGKGSPILYSTTDPNDPVAIKARNPDAREEVVNGKKIRHVEHLNFFVRIYQEGHPLNGMLCMLIFARASHRDGRNLAKLIKMRRASPFVCVFQMRTVHRSNDSGDWYSFEVDNPTVGNAWVSSKEEAEEMKSLHEAAMAVVKSNKLRIDHDEADFEASTVSLEASEV